MQDSPGQEAPTGVPAGKTKTRPHRAPPRTRDRQWAWRLRSLRDPMETMCVGTRADLGCRKWVVQHEEEGAGNQNTDP